MYETLYEILTNFVIFLLAIWVGEKVYKHFNKEE